MAWASEQNFWSNDINAWIRICGSILTYFKATKSYYLNILVKQILHLTEIIFDI